MALADDNWTLDLERHIRRLKGAGLIPPIGAVQVVERRGRDVLQVDVRVPLTHELADRISTVLQGVPHELRGPKGPSKAAR